VIPLGFDLSRFMDDRPAKRALFRRVYGVADDEVAIGIVGRLVPSRTTTSSWKPSSRCATKTGNEASALSSWVMARNANGIEQRTRELGLAMAMAPATSTGMASGTG
jgi:hypothetical protein